MFKYFKLYKDKGVILASMIPFLSNNNADDIKVARESQNDESRDGWERLRQMFKIDEFGDLSRELTTISQTAMLSGFVGIIYGGLMSSRTTYTNFMRNNTASSFSSHFDAKKKLQDAMTRSIAKGGWRWCWRLSVFSTTFVGITTMVSVYRGKNGILEYVLAGATTGTLYKWQMGPRGWVVGAGLGTMLGLTSGTLTYLLLKITGQSMDEVRMSQQSFGDYRTEIWKKGMKEYRDKEDKLLQSHDQKASQQNIESK